MLETRFRTQICDGEQNEEIQNDAGDACRFGRCVCCGVLDTSGWFGRWNFCSKSGKGIVMERGSQCGAGNCAFVMGFFTTGMAYGFGIRKEQDRRKKILQAPWFGWVCLLGTAIVLFLLFPVVTVFDDPFHLREPALLFLIFGIVWARMLTVYDDFRKPRLRGSCWKRLNRGWFEEYLPDFAAGGFVLHLVGIDF